MRRRARSIVLVVAALLVCLADANAVARPARPPRIGYLESITRPALAKAFSRGLKDHGYVEGLNIIIEHRSARGQAGRLPSLAAELVRLHPRVIVASGPTSILAAKDATATIPIVMTHVGDPVALGLVASLSRPGGNITGLSTQSVQLSDKRLELLAELVPGFSRVGVVWDRANQISRLRYRELQDAATSLHLEFVSFEVARPEDFDAAFTAAAARTGGVAVLPSPFFNRYRETISAVAARHKVPTIYSPPLPPGGLMSYGASLLDLHRRAAAFVDKILKGAKPSDLPVEQPTRFYLTVNLKTAKVLGIAIPNSILLRADKVIE